MAAFTAAGHPVQFLSGTQIRTVSLTLATLAQVGVDTAAGSSNRGYVIWMTPANCQNGLTDKPVFDELPAKTSLSLGHTPR